MNITRLFKDFFDSEKAGGFILIGCALISLLVANTSIGNGIPEFLHSYVDLSFGGLKLGHTVEEWVNDGLMTIFFLLVGLEIERELYEGELSSFRNAILPVVAAVGGMLFPALIHYSFNAGTETVSGFGIPMATDIAFALGVLSIAGKHVPVSLKIFLTALAIIDDLGAIAVIAIFYNEDFAATWFFAALAIFLLLYGLGRVKIYALWVYLIGGVIMWYCMMKSGVHATISGVLLAFAIPFTRDDDSNPSYHLQHFLHKPVSFIILPIFALANTGLVLHEGLGEKMFENNNLGIILGLVLGKPLGIILFSWLLVRARWSNLPSRVTWKHLLGAGMLAGIGFTMSIFISNLAFKDPELIQFSKIAVLTGSLFSCLIGLIFLYFTPKGVEENCKVQAKEIL